MDTPPPQPPRLLDQMRDALRVRHYSLRTEQAYIHWTKRFIYFHGKRYPRELGPKEVEAFLTALAVEGGVSASTQAQALAALLFLYKQVLETDLPWLDEQTANKQNKQGHRTNRNKQGQTTFHSPNAPQKNHS